MKITDNNDQLKYAVALEATGMAEGGANKPLFITALNRTTGESEEFVLKYRGSERMNEKRSARELIEIKEHLTEFKKEIWTKLLIQ